MFFHDRLDPNETFRERRRRARRRRQLRRAVLLVVVCGAGAAIFLGATLARRGGHPPVAVRQALTPRPVAQVSFSQLPREIRGVHVTMGLASLDGKLDEYLDMTKSGLNTIELDVKDEAGHVGFVPASVPLAAQIGAARPYYRAAEVARAAHARGVYLIGRVVVFEDPVLAEQRPALALQNPNGSVWHTSVGLGWVNEYDQRVWRYDVGIAVAAAQAGFDEIQFDYVRFPSDGDVQSIVFRHRVREPKGQTIARFLEYAASQLHPLGVRVSADLFGLAAKRDLGVGQVPSRLGRVLDSISPMVYPSHYGAGEYNVSDPNSEPGVMVARSLRSFRLALKKGHARLVPWLQDFSLGRTYTLEDVQQQVTAARLLGARGFLLWNAEGLYTDGALAPEAPRQRVVLPPEPENS